MSVKAMESVKQSVNVIVCVCAAKGLCVSPYVCVCVCVGKTIRQCFDSHVTRRGSVSGDPAMRTPDYPPCA